MEENIILGAILMSFLILGFALRNLFNFRGYKVTEEDRIYQKQLRTPKEEVIYHTLRRGRAPPSVSLQILKTYQNGKTRIRENERIIPIEPSTISNVIEQDSSV